MTAPRFLAVISTDGELIHAVTARDRDRVLFEDGKPFQTGPTLCGLGRGSRYLALYRAGRPRPDFTEHTNTPREWLRGQIANTVCPRCTSRVNRIRSQEDR